MKRVFHPYIWLTVLTALLTVSVGRAQTTEYKLMHQGNQAFHQRNYDRAANYYLQVLRKNPNHSRATFNLADSYLAKGDVKAADSLYNRVTQLERNTQIRSMAWHNRGYICQTAALKDQQNEQQLLRAAIEHYKQALRLNPHDNDTRYNLALCQRQLKNSPNQNQQKDQKQQQQQQKQQQKKDEQKQDQQKKQDEKNLEQERQQTEQYLNLAKQAERRALERLKGQQPRQKSLEKNW